MNERLGEVMKDVSELGISPMPWRVSESLSSFPIKTCAVKACGYIVAGNVLEPDARLIAKSPDMYYALKCCIEKIESIIDYEGYDFDTGALLTMSKNVLAEAAGEEVK